jgi:hypothetical protein
VPLHHAPDGDERAAGAGRLQPAGFHDGVDGLALRRVDEAAGVDDDDLGVLEVRRVLDAAVDETRQVALGVDRVLVAAEGDEADLQGRPTSCGGDTT